MAYEVTASRRRPKTFDEMAGQDFVVATLKSSLETGRIAHAYLFSGPRGCGKTSAARILARSLNCEQGPTASPCGVCPNCVDIARGSSLDVIEIDGASNTSVNDVRQIKDEVLFPPNSGRYKIYIIDEVHMLSNSAFNALLKTIEEPPPYIVFMFATTELHKVPATIKSRCQQFNFRLFSVDTIKRLLADACAEAGIQAEDEALFWIAKEATGSMRDAYTLFDQVVAFSDGKLRSELIKEKLGLVGLDAVNALAEACAAEDSAQALSMVDAILERGVSIEQFVTDLAGYYRSLLLLKSGVSKEAILGFAPERFSTKVLESLSPQQLERGVSLLLDLYRDLRFSVSPRFELETAVSSLCWLSRWVSPAELRDAVAGVRGLLLEGGNGARWGPAESGPSVGVSPPKSEASVSASSAAEPVRDPFTQEPVPAENLDLAKPGAFTETFKRFIAAKASGAPSGDLLPRAESSPDAAAPSAPAAPAVSVPAPEPEQAAQQTRLPAAPPPSTPFSGADGLEEDVEEEALPPSEPEDVAEEVPGERGPDPEFLRRDLIAFFKKERGMLASGLEKSLPWERDGSRIVIAVKDRLSAELLRKEGAALSSALHQLGGAGLSIDIVERQGTSESAMPAEGKNEIPQQAELVRRMFRGTIIKAK